MKMGIKVNRPADIISSILTSGGKQTAMKGKSKIKEIIQQFDSRFNIIAAGSITEKKIYNVHSHIRSKEYHGRKIVAELQ
jgi:copper homeostasis protein